MNQENDLLNWTHRFRFLLKDIPDNQKKAIWDRWLCQYWEDRTNDVPVPFIENEAAGMIDWVIELSPVFPKAASAICKSESVDVGHTSIYTELVEKGLAEKYPNPTADLLLHLAKGHKHPLPPQESYMCHEMLDLVRALREHGVAIDKLKAICEELVELACSQALDILDSF
jgi:hypothetical protein